MSKNAENRNSPPARRRPRRPSRLWLAAVAGLSIFALSAARGEDGPARQPASGASAAATRTDQAARRPNVLFLFSDDQRPDAVGAVNPRIRTPHIDSLVSRGCSLRRAYCMGSTVPAVCLPSRSMLMTGRTLFRLPPQGRSVGDDVPLLPRAMRQAGYRTMRTGKTGNHPAYADAEFHQNFNIPHHRTCSTEHADNAIKFLADWDRSEPFFLYVAFGAPHDPRIAPERFMQMYRPEDMQLPANYLPQHPFDNGEMTIRDEKLAPWPRTEQTIRQHLADYYSITTYMDDEIGRILKALEQTGQAENTYIIFSSDHGLAVGSHGLMGKQNLYEHSMGVPLTFVGPGIAPGSRSDALCYLHDIFPTICDLVGAEIPRGVEFRSLAPVLRGDQEQVRDVVFTAYRDVQRAVCTPRWKLIRYPQIARTQLFDLENDPHELRNLADDPAHASRAEEMLKLLASEQKRHGDTLPLTAADVRSPKFTPPTEE